MSEINWDAIVEANAHVEVIHIVKSTDNLRVVILEPDNDLPIVIFERRLHDAAGTPYWSPEDKPESGLSLLADALLHGEIDTSVLGECTQCGTLFTNDGPYGDAKCRACDAGRVDIG